MKNIFTKLFCKRFGLSLVSIVCFYLAFILPVWNFQFNAPQYPDGLELKIYLTNTTGDVQEIGIINHYIGMQKLEDAAKNEKKLVPYILVILSVCSLALVFTSGVWLTWLLALPILGFPVGFVSMFYFWLYKFGHELNPAAPVTMEPFTPTMFGTGIIGQFKTFSQPSIGYYFIVLAAVATLTQIYLKRKKMS